MQSVQSTPPPIGPDANNAHMLAQFLGGDHADENAAVRLQLLSGALQGPLATKPKDSMLNRPPIYASDNPSHSDSIESGNTAGIKVWCLIIDQPIVKSTRLLQRFRSGSLPTVDSNTPPPVTLQPRKSLTKHRGSGGDRMVRNREAAARSRLRQKLVMSELQSRVNRLEAANTMLSNTLHLKESQLRQALELLESLSATLLNPLHP